MHILTQRTPKLIQFSISLDQYNQNNYCQFNIECHFSFKPHDEQEHIRLFVTKKFDNLEYGPLYVGQ